MLLRVRGVPRPCLVCGWVTPGGAGNEGPWTVVLCSEWVSGAGLRREGWRPGGLRPPSATLKGHAETMPGRGW